ncbi:TA system VapC family ribonuclease toxin [Mesorhizobium sp. PUT5]|uniref:TA system VapC family ribonuclease toxin n=1 Tax=Mesorhizobium sp. PUT5 TaxID=3454629 RepID=UPI003FA47005
MTFLLDVNVLVALIDPGHVAHDAAHGWFERVGNASWATCPLTEDGVVRIVGNPRYPNSPGSPAAVAEIVTVLRTLAGHTFWADDISLFGGSHADPRRILAPHQVTDTYLLALAQSKGGVLATFDRKLSTAAVAGGRDALHHIGA